MNRIMRTVLVSLYLLFLLAGDACAQDLPVEPLSAIVRSGDAAGLSHYFGATIDVRINGTETEYSPAQGMLVLREFFTRNVPRSFEIQSTGNAAAGNASFIIGTLNTSGGRYMLYLFLKPVGGVYQVKTIRLQK